MAKPTDPRVSTVPSQTMVLTGSVYAPASRAAHSAAVARPLPDPARLT